MGVATEDFFRTETHLAEGFAHLLPRLFLVPCEAELADGHREHVINRVERVVRSERVLKDRLDILPKLPSLSPAEGCHVLAPVEDLTRGWTDEPHEQGTEG